MLITRKTDSKYYHQRLEWVLDALVSLEEPVLAKDISTQVKNNGQDISTMWITKIIDIYLNSGSPVLKHSKSGAFRIVVTKKGSHYVGKTFAVEKVVV